MKRLWAVPIIASILIIGAIGFLFNQDSFALGATISDQASCEAFGGTWTSPPDKCKISNNFTVNSGETFTVSSNVLLFMNRVFITINDGGTVNNFGNIESVSDGGFGVHGTLNNSGEIFLGEISTIRIESTGIVNIDCGGTITGEFDSRDNFGKIIFDGGTLASICVDNGDDDDGDDDDEDDDDDDDDDDD